jgi:threonine aldolase
MSYRIDLISDTVTRPGPGMRAAMAAAEVGDEQREGDPTSDRLCERVASLLGKEAAIFLPSGTMCNLVATAVHCRPGDVVIAERSAHVVSSELGGIAAVAGALALTIEGRRGQFSVADAEEAIAGLAGGRAPRARLLWLEQTCNRGGGSVWPIDALRGLAAFCRERGLIAHMDGARLLNAVVAGGVSAAENAACVDTVWIDFSKGLGCPAGAALAGSRAFIKEAEVWKRRLGGALRQSGILAAAAEYALDGFEPRFARDHALAARLAAGASGIPGVSIVDGSVETNLVFLDVAGTGLSAREVSARMGADGVRVGVDGKSTLRLVTHADVAEADIEEALTSLRKVAEVATAP